MRRAAPSHRRASIRLISPPGGGLPETLCMTDERIFCSNEFKKGPEFLYEQAASLLDGSEVGHLRLGTRLGRLRRLGVVDNADHLSEDPVDHTGIVDLGRDVDQGLEVLQRFFVVHVGLPGGNHASNTNGERLLPAARLYSGHGEQV